MRCVRARLHFCVPANAISAPPKPPYCHIPVRSHTVVVNYRVATLVVNYCGVAWREIPVVTTYRQPYTADKGQHRQSISVGKVLLVVIPFKGPSSCYSQLS